MSNIAQSLGTAGIQQCLVLPGVVHPLRPLVKWAGGKGRLINVLTESMPKEFNRYIEPFLGGGALFWYLARPFSVIADSNPELINFYAMVRDHPLELLRKVRGIPIAKDEFYLQREAEPNELDNISRAARFIYLNKTCYNGLYRVNRRGKFNTPYGGNTNITVLEEENLWQASILLKQTEFFCSDYAELIPHLKRGDFVYFDPPYLPIGEYSDFNRYTESFFFEKDHAKLFQHFSMLESRGIKALLSNSYNDRILEMYKGFPYKVVEASRQINCRPLGRGKIRELLIANYPI